jgi:tRNA pseudouridine55 synthase
MPFTPCPAPLLRAHCWTSDCGRSKMGPTMTLFGILNVNKRAGRTSRRVVDHIQGLVHPAKAGHAGTLDPLATGVLVICVGQATRLIEYVQRMPKQYRATFLLGRRSETDDVEGEVSEVAGSPEPSRAKIEQLLPQFLGEIQQVPPAHSAVKIGGRRAYKLARAGKAFELAPRTVSIHRLAIRHYEYPELELDIECGSGTYVRSLGRDIAAALATSAVMSALERTAIGCFRVEDAVDVDDVTPETLPKHLQPALAALPSLPRVVLSDAELIEIRHGRPATTSLLGALEVPIAATDEFAAVNSAGELVTILYEKKPGELWPARNFL